MGFRTVVIKSRAKLEFQMNYLVCRGEVEKKIHLSEISVLIVESTAISLTTELLNQLIKSKIKVIFCDEKHLPSSQLLGFDDNYHSSKQIFMQTQWAGLIKEQVWTNIIFNKINNQAKLMRKLELSNAELLFDYLNELQLCDATNREGHAAKVYFNEMFQDNKTRRVPSFWNTALNYGYAILLAMFCREITASGCITQIGVWHSNEFNPYNLASDLMETFRVVVDESVLALQDGDLEYKRKIQNILNYKILIDGKNVYLDNAIEIYVKSVIGALNENNEKLIKNMEGYELSLYENNGNV